MAKAVTVRTRAGGQVSLSVIEGYNFIASMKAAKSDGALITDQVMIPWDAIDIVMLTDAELTQPAPPKTEQN
jgi:hypothetical protein